MLITHLHVVPFRTSVRRPVVLFHLFAVPNPAPLLLLLRPRRGQHDRSGRLSVFGREGRLQLRHDEDRLVDRAPGSLVGRRVAMAQVPLNGRARRGRHPERTHDTTRQRYRHRSHT